MNEHRVPMLGGAWRRRSDPLRSPDPRVRELVAALASLEIAPAPRAEFRAELRAQLVAVTPRLVAEGEPAAALTPTTATRPARARKDATERTERRGFRFAKPLIAAACILTTFVLLLGAAVLLSRHALPGDALYGIKRASEDTQYNLTGGNVAKGKLKLEFASRRVGEVAALLPQASAMAPGVGAVAGGASINSGTASLITDTLKSADGDVYTASQLLTSSAVRTGASGPLTDITAWTPNQLTAIRHVIARIPTAGSLHQQALHSLAVVQAARQRANALRADLRCSCLTTGTSDRFGPVPCHVGCSSATAPRTQPSTKPGGRPQRRTGPAVGHTRTATVPTTAPQGTRPAGKTTTTPVITAPTTGGAGSPSATPGGGSSPPSIPGLPSVPGIGQGSTAPGGGAHDGPILPISVGSCGAKTSIGALNLGIGGC